MPLTHCLASDHKQKITKQAIYETLQCPHTSAERYLSKAYEQGHMIKFTAQYQNISSALLVSWLLNCAEQVIQNIATNLKISFRE